MIGSRKSERKNSPLSRKVMSRGFMLLREGIVGIKDISDTQCGFKAFKGEAADKIFTKIKSRNIGI